MKTLFVAVLLLAPSAVPSVAGTRLKELVSIEGVRDNQLMGYGLVVGLAGTGDRRQTVFSAQSLTNLLQRMGLVVAPTALQVKNTAAVMVTSTLPPFAQPGSRIDATVAAIGDCSSLQGGILLMTGLKAPDGQVYSVAQGGLVLGGFAAGGGGNGQVVNHPTVGRIPNGAIIERASPTANPGANIRLQLQHADFTTASRVTAVLNQKFGSVAHTDNAGVVSVAVPAEYRTRSAEFIAELERLTVEPDREAKVVVNERTGTIVMGKEVHISPVAVMQGSLTVEIETSLSVSQPNPLSNGTTQVAPQTTIGAKQDAPRNVLLKEGATVEELVRALSAIGSSPRDIVAILQSLKSAGALEAILEVI